VAEPTEPREYVLRALAASEIAESATRPDLKRSFNQLVETWLEKAEQSAAGEAED
jgi:hypothetical protein